jgi:transitional endoplasmic reticulum ATPase
MIALRCFLANAPPEAGATSSAAPDLGALQVTLQDFEAALVEVAPSATREFFIENCSATFASLGGLQEVKRLLEAVVDHAHLGDELYERVGLTPPRGILFVGPPGTGKTAMARALSGQKRIPLIAIEGGDLYSKWLGESEKALHEIFKKARRAAPCILFLDTIDALAPKLAADHLAADVQPRIVSQLLREIDDLRDVRGVILLAATSRPERVEPALLRSGRFDYTLRFEKPDAAERAASLHLFCRRLPLAPDVDLEALAARTDGLSGADLESLCKKATLRAIAGFRSETSGAPFVVRSGDFLALLSSEETS